MRRESRFGSLIMSIRKAGIGASVTPTPRSCEDDYCKALEKIGVLKNGIIKKLPHTDITVVELIKEAYPNTK